MIRRRRVAKKVHASAAPQGLVVSRPVSCFASVRRIGATGTAGVVAATNSRRNGSHDPIKSARPSICWLRNTVNSRRRRPRKERLHGATVARAKLGAAPPTGHQIGSREFVQCRLEERRAECHSRPTSPHLYHPIGGPIRRRGWSSFLLWSRDFQAPRLRQSDRAILQAATFPSSRIGSSRRSRRKFTGSA
jgi:hypothetical protein